jgi:S-adenosylmethionine/arginine decarboxylase-like enzyme
MTIEHWGYHLLVDAGGCSEAINNVYEVKSFLRVLVDKLEMFPIGPPMVVYMDTEEGRGVSGVQLITTSTITFHGDAEGNRVFIDVFSCQSYEPRLALTLIEEYFQPKALKHLWVYRDAPNSIESTDTSTTG